MLAIGIASGLVLFSPDTLIKSLGMTAIRTEHKAEIGGAVLLSIAYLSATTILWLKDVIIKAWKSRQSRIVREQRLRELTPEMLLNIAPSDNKEVRTIAEQHVENLRNRGSEFPVAC